MRPDAIVFLTGAVSYEEDFLVSDRKDAPKAKEEEMREVFHID